MGVKGRNRKERRELSGILNFLSIYKDRFLDFWWGVNRYKCKLEIRNTEVVIN